MLESGLAALAWMGAVEIEGERVEELKLLVVLKQLSLVEPGCGDGVFRKLRLEPFLSLELAIEHSPGERSVLRRDLVDEDHGRKAIAPVIEPPAVHARHETAKGMLPLIVVGRQPAGDRDVFRRSLDEGVRQAGLRIRRRITVELSPAGIVWQHDVEHQIVRIGRLKLLVPEGAGELMR